MPTGLTQPRRQYIHDGSPPPDAVDENLRATNDRQMVFTADGERVSQATTSTTASNPQSQALTQYYEHSIALHEELQSSQIVGAESTNGSPVPTNTEGLSFESSIISDAGSEDYVVHARLHSIHISDLKEMPNASYLNSITPQTVTVNLVAGIITISQPRTIKSRKGGRTVELVEMLVGDETRAGFEINIWLPPIKNQDSKASRSSVRGQNTMRDEVLRLRPRDVVLARRVALSSFKSNVYGQSLRRGMTTLDLLYRNLVDSEDARGALKAREIDANVGGSGQLGKVKKVKDWVMQFVGAGPQASTMKNRAEKGSEPVHLPSLPPDTQ